MITLEQALLRATGQLSASSHLRSSALADAALLLMHVLEIPRATLIAHPERMLTRDQQSSYQRLLERRLNLEPLQYILGKQEFFGLELRVTSAVLIPRPETEILVEAVLARVPHQTPIRIADVGTGSGAIAIALAYTLRRALVTAIDLSPTALEIARKNVTAHELIERIELRSSNLLAALREDEPFDVIVSNPPYVATSSAHELHPQVRDFEPAEALFAGPTGLEVYEQLIPQAFRLLRSGGLLALEIGYGQQEQVAARLSDWNEVEFVPDLQQIPRVALARRP